MRVRSVLVARRFPGGLFALVVLALVACSTPPSEQIIEAEAKFSELEAKGGEQYLTFEIAEIRRGIEEARKDLRNNREAEAGIVLSDIGRKLDSCTVALEKLKSYAEKRSRDQYAFLGAQLRVLEGVLDRLPKLTYVDQNRYDIHKHRLRRYHRDLEGMEALIRDENFPEALEKGSNLQLQVAKVFSGLSDVSSEIALTQTTVQKQDAPRPEEKSSSRIAGVLSVTAQ